MAKTNIVGTEFAETKAEGIQEGSDIQIVHDPSNKHDDKALAVYLMYNGGITEPERLGYIGRGTDIYDLPRDQFPKSAVVVDFYIKSNDDEKFKRHQVGNLVSCNIEIPDVKIANQSEDEELILSFNEEGIEIAFNENEHYYKYNGTFLKGATTYIKKYIKEFEVEMVSKNCETHWKIPQKEIRSAWNLAGDLAAAFGTGIHKALEYEDRYRSYLKPKDGTRCFRIKNPAISKIVNEFYDLNESLGFKGQIFPEALISDVKNGNCALADRIIVRDVQNKVCRLQDYKVNYDFDVVGQVKFKNLPKGVKLSGTKLSKLALQLKQQRTMLEKSGWTVEGVDAFVYDGRWNYYEVNTLEGFNIETGAFN